MLEFQESTLKHRQYVDFIRIRSIVMEMDIIANAMKGRLSVLAVFKDVNVL